MTTKPKTCLMCDRLAVGRVVNDVVGGADLCGIHLSEYIANESGDVGQVVDKVLDDTIRTDERKGETTGAYTRRWIVWFTDETQAPYN